MQTSLRPRRAGPSQEARPSVAPGDLPQNFTVEWVGSVQKLLLDSTRAGIGGLAAVLPAATLCSLLDALAVLLKSEPTLKEARCSSTLHTRSCISCQSQTASRRDTAGFDCPRSVFTYPQNSFFEKQVQPQSPGTTVTVVGDTHGQFHDVCEM